MGTGKADVGINLRVDDLEALMRFLNPHDGAGYKIRCLQAHFDRSIREYGLEVGTRCRLRKTIEVGKGSGWWPTRYTLTKGREGVVREVMADSRTGRLFCYWLPDVECLEISDHRTLASQRMEPRKPKYRAITGPDRHVYAIALDSLEPIDG